MSLHGGIIQSVLFNKKMWSVLDSVIWCLHHGHKVINITDEPNDIQAEGVYALGAIAEGVYALGAIKVH